MSLSLEPRLTPRGIDAVPISVRTAAVFFRLTIVSIIQLDSQKFFFKICYLLGDIFML